MCDSLKVVRALDCNVKEQSGPNMVVSIHMSLFHSIQFGSDLQFLWIKHYYNDCYDSLQKEI